MLANLLRVICGYVRSTDSTVHYTIGVTVSSGLVAWLFQQSDKENKK